MYADEPEFVEIMQDDDFMENRIFESVDAAYQWLEKNAKVGWCTRIVDLDD